MKYSFKNDYSEIAHPLILKALINCQEEQNNGYGEDIHSAHAEELIKNTFGATDSKVFFLSGGTQTNMVFISYCLKPYEAVLACSSGHINVHETGAVEGTGHKIITVDGIDGKLNVELIRNIISDYQDCHMVKIKMIYISNTTEIGTIYTKKEIEDIYSYCKNKNLYLFIDGARLSSALTSRDNDIKKEDMGKLCDGFYAGGTKIGLTSGEALIINNPLLSIDFRYHIKNKGAMLAKGFVLGIEYEEAFKNNLYFEMGKHENEMAYYLANKLENLNFKFLSKVQSNQLFVIMDNLLISKLSSLYAFEKWCNIDSSHSCIRLVTSWFTKKEAIDEFINDLKGLI